VKRISATLNLVVLEEKRGCYHFPREVEKPFLPSFGQGKEKEKKSGFRLREEPSYTGKGSMPLAEERGVLPHPPEERKEKN